MKLTLMLLFLTVLTSIAADSYSQSVKLTLKFENARIEDVLGRIEYQSKFRFFYNEEINLEKKISLNASDETIVNILDEIFRGKGIHYEIIDRQIILTKEGNNSNTSVLQQQKSVSGKVSDSTGGSLPGVSVVVKGTTTGTITDIDGKYSLNNVPANATLIFSFVGMRSQEIEVGSKASINVQLEDETIGIEEVVAVGYGVQKKSVITGSISSIKSEDLANSSISRAEQALQGKTAGVQVISSSGAPGAGINVRIRGYGSNRSSEPIYIVNGTRIENLNSIDPNDIKNMEVLKDAASSAIYGAEGANGVVLVTTKSGESGKGRLTYEYQYSIQSMAKKVDLMNAADYKQYYTEAGTLPSSALSDTYDTDWQKELFKASPTQKHYLSFTGGGEKGSYLLSMSYLNQDGIVVGDKDKYKRFTFTLNSDYKLNSWIKTGHNVTFTRSDLKSLAENSEYASVITSALMMDPLTPVYYKDNSEMPVIVQNGIANGNKYLKNADGYYYGVSKYVSSIPNPFVSRDATNPSNQNNILFGNVFAEITPFRGLVLTSRLGGSLAANQAHVYNPVYFYDASTYNNSSFVSDANSTTLFWQWENFASYNKVIGNHNATILVGVSSSEGKFNYLYADGSPLTTDSDMFDDLSYLVSNPSDNVKSLRSKTAKLSYFGRLTYDYKSKYMLQFSLRKDAAGMDILPARNRWGTFPAASAGWVISNESFFPKTILTFAKIRASWGQNGSLSNLNNYPYAAALVSSGAFPDYETSTSVTMGTATIPANLSNYDLKWETSEQTDFGVDLRAFNDKMTFSVDYYIKKTKDLLTTGTPPLEAGNNATTVNAGDVENRGFEFETTYRSKIGKLNYSIGANVATLHNEVTYMNPNSPYLSGATVNLQTATRFDKGHPIWYFYGYKTNGVDPATGATIFVNSKGENVKSVTAADKQYIGSGIPTLTYGLNIDLNYKGFDFKAFLSGASGQDIMLGMVRTDRLNFNKLQIYFDDRWTSANTNGSMPAANCSSDTWHSDLLVFKGNYLKMKQLQFGYTLPKRISEKIKALNARLYISGENLFTITKYPGSDPEVGANPNATYANGDLNTNYINSIGIDRGMYPSCRTILFGTTITF